MKIAISELDRQETLRDLDSTTGRAIVGGKTGVEIFAESFASGDLSVTQSDANVYNFEFETEKGVYSFSLGFGYAFAFSFEANEAKSA